MKFIAMMDQTITGKDTKEKKERVVSGGRPGEMNTEQLAAHIQAKSSRAISDEAAKNCAGAILGHPGGNDAGDALNGIQCNGNAIYHNTRNKPNVSQGCTVFFSDAGNGYAKLIAVANHIGTKPNVYDMDWVARDFRLWRKGRSVAIGG